MSRYVFVCCYRSMLVSRYVFGYVVTGLLQCLGMCLDMLLQVYVTVSRYVFGYVVTGLFYSV